MVNMHAWAIQLLGSIFQIVGVCAGILGVLDLVLSKNSKDNIQSALESWWIILNDKRHISFINLLTNRIIQNKIRLFILIPLGALYLIFTVFMVFITVVKSIADRITFLDIVDLIPPLIIVAYLFFGHRRLTEYIARGRNTKEQILHIAKSLFFLFLIWIVLLQPFHLYAYIKWNVYNDPDLLEWLDPYESIVTFPIIVFLAMYLFQFMIYLGWILTTSALSLLLVIADRVVLTVVTYEKGPLLALAAICTSVGLILQPFS